MTKADNGPVARTTRTIEPAEGLGPASGPSGRSDQLILGSGTESAGEAMAAAQQEQAPGRTFVRSQKPDRHRARGITDLGHVPLPKNEQRDHGAAA
jgi:hypothetical protein